MDRKFEHLNRRAIFTMGSEVESEWTEDQLAAWTGYVMLASRLRARHDREFEAEHGLSLSAIGILGRLSIADHRALRLSDLAGEMDLSPARISRQMDALEARGFVGRKTCESDARAVNAFLTQEGAAAVTAAQKTVRHAVERDFISILSEDELRELKTIVQKLNAVFDGADSPCSD